MDKKIKNSVKKAFHLNRKDELKTTLKLQYVGNILFVSSPSTHATLQYIYLK